MRLAILVILGIILLQTLAAFLTPFYAQEGYFLLRQVEHVAQNGVPFYYDQLSFGGRPVVVMPLLPYLLSWTWFNPDIMLKVLSKLMVAGLLIAVFVYSGYSNKAVLSILFLGFSSFLWSQSVYQLSAPLVVCLLAILSSILYQRSRKDRKSLIYLLVISTSMLFIHPLAYVWILGLTLYLFICWIEQLRIGNWEREYVFYIIIAALVTGIFFYRDMLSQYQINTLFQNMPLQLRAQYFIPFTALESFALLGLVPVIATIWVMYTQAYRSKDKQTLFVGGQLLSVFILLVLTIIPFEHGMLYLSCYLVIFIPTALNDWISFIHKTKFKWLEKLTVPVLILVLLLNNSAPLQGYASPPQVTLLPITQENTVIAPPQLGQYIAYTYGAKTFVDLNFLGAPDPSARLEDFATINRAVSTTRILGVIEKYDLQNVVLFSDNDRLDPDCFVPLSQNIYEVTCSLETN